MANSGPLSLLILSAHPRAAEDLRGVLAKLPEFTITLETAHFDSGMRAIRAGDPDVIAIILDGHPQRALPLIEKIHRHAPLSALFAFAQDHAAGTAIRLLRAGATECLVFPIDVDRLAAALHKVRMVKGMASAPDTARTGAVWTVLGPKVGVGATTLVANLGLELRAIGTDVVLVDLDLQAAELALFLNLEPPDSLLEIARNRKRLDPVFVQGTLARHPSGLYLLAGPPQALHEPACVPVECVMSTLDLLRASHGLVIVDAPPPLEAAVVAACRRSERVIVPTELTVPCLRATWRTLSALTEWGIRPAQLDVVVTKYDPRHTDLTLAEVSEALKVPLACTLPRDDATAIAAANKGLSLAEIHSGSPLRHAVAAWARELIDGPKAVGAQQVMTRGQLSA